MPTGFREIAEQLRRAIERGEYPRGSRIPTEHALAKQHGVSRETIRRALALLKAEGLLEAATSRGTYVPEPPVRLAIARYGAVVDPGRDLQDLGPWETACAQQGRTGRAEVASVEREPATAELAERLQVAAGDELVRRSRRMWVDDQLAQLQDAWMPAAVVDGTPLAQPGKVIGGVYAAMSAAGLAPTTVSEEVAARMPTSEERSQMQLGDGATVLEIWRTTRDQHGQTIEVLRTIASGRLSRLVYDNLPIGQAEG